MNMSYAGQKVLITGASAGIGEAFARELHKCGAEVVLVARRVDRLEECAAEFNKQRAGSASILKADLSNSSECSLVEKYIEDHHIDILVNNAGRGSFGFYENLSRDEEEQMVQLNVIAQLRLTHAVIPQMKKRRSGSIVIVSSVAAFQPLPFMSTYAATKAFNFSHALGLHYELRKDCVNVLAVCPGPTATEFGSVARASQEFSNMSSDPVSVVVMESLLALQKRRSYVVTGMRSKLLSFMSMYSPLRISCNILARKFRPAEKL